MFGADFRFAAVKLGLLAAVMLAPLTPGDSAAAAEEAIVAVAPNFMEPAKAIVQKYEKQTHEKITLSFGATGQFYVQITQGAPFDILLSADQSTPKKLADSGLALGETLFTYAVGRLVLYSKNPELVQGEQTLRDGNFDKIAVANPLTAPYGAAAIEAMKHLGVYDKLASKIVQGNDVAQTFGFVDTGAAPLGFVALSEVIDKTGGSRWIVPDNLYTSIRQDAVLLKKGSSNGTARSFLSFLKGDEAKQVMERFGYLER